MVDFKKMLGCVFEVSKVVLDVDKRTMLGISCMDTCLDDLESGYRVQVGEVEDIHRSLQEMERVRSYEVL